YTVHRAAERTACDVRRNVAAEPVLHEDTRDPVTSLYPGNAGSNVDDFAGAVRQRNQRQLQTTCISTFRNQKITVIQRYGVHTDQLFPARRFRNISFDSN